jgi:hypothetical protein
LSRGDSSLIAHRSSLISSIIYSSIIYSSIIYIVVGIPFVGRVRPNDNVKQRPCLSLIHSAYRECFSVANAFLVVSSTMEPAKDAASSKKTRPGVITIAVVVSIVVVAALAALAAVIVVFQEIKHYSPKAPVVTNYFTEEEGHRLGLEA